MYSEEQNRKEVADTFLEAFKEKDLSIALYGTGINTEEILHRVENMGGYNIVGLLDAQKEGQVIHGYPVLSVQEASKCAKCIVIVARKEVIPIIYQRIAHLEQDGVEICNIRYERISNASNVSYRAYPYWNQTERLLESEIDRHDVITFDIFDTLLVRNVQRPDDIFKIVEKRLENVGFKYKFKEMRDYSQSLAYEKYIYPTYSQIYSIMQELYGLSDEVADFIKQMELDTEREFADVRKTIQNMITYAYRAGKKVFLLSDMYLGKTEIEYILNKFGFNGVLDIYVSCDLKKRKWPGGDIFEWLKDKHGHENRYLHIGDSIGADIEKAEEHGVDAFYIMSAYDMMVHSSANKLLVNVQSLSDSIIIGMLCSHLFNNPFVLSETSGDIFIEDSYEYGYLAFGALVTGTVNWMMSELADQENIHIWFLSRDGYIFEKACQIYQKYAGKQISKIDYVLCSRRNASVAAIYNWKDIEYSLNFVPKELTNSAMFKYRFGLNTDLPADVDNRERKQAAFELKNEILKNAERERIQYRKYLGKRYNDDEKIVIFDLVTSGTIPLAMEKILDRELDLYCVSGLKVSGYSVLDQLHNYSMYFGHDLKYAAAFHINKQLGNVESVLTSKDSMFICMDEDCRPVFWNKEKSQRNIVQLELSHKGILDFVDKFYSLVGGSGTDHITAKLTDDCIGLFMDAGTADKRRIRENFGCSDYFSGGDVDVE